MTTPTTNLTLSSVQTEFGGADPISMSEYYKGGSYVPSGVTDGGYGTPPTSGAITMGAMRNLQKGVVSGGSQSVTSSQSGSGSSTASVTFNTDGTTSGTAGAHLLGWNVSVHNWWTLAPDASVGSRYWISFNSGSWLALSGSRTQSLSGTNASSSIPYRISSDSGGGTIVATGAVALTVENGQ